MKDSYLNQKLNKQLKNSSRRADAVTFQPEEPAAKVTNNILLVQTDVGECIWK